MTKKQILAECRRLAPDFALTFEVIKGRDCIVARCTHDGEKLELAQTLGTYGRATIETAVLESAHASLKSRVAESARKGPR